MRRNKDYNPDAFNSYVNRIVPVDISDSIHVYFIHLTSGNVHYLELFDDSDAAII